MTAVLLILSFFSQDADCRSCETLSRMASALSEGNSVKAMGFFGQSTSGYYAIQSNLDAITSQNEVACSLDVLAESGDDDRVEATVDWFFQLTSKDGSEHVVRRRNRVRVVEQKIKGTWRITSLEPRSILDPP